MHDSITELKEKHAHSTHRSLHNINISKRKKFNCRSVIKQIAFSSSSKEQQINAENFLFYLNRKIKPVFPKKSTQEKEPLSTRLHIAFI